VIFVVGGQGFLGSAFVRQCQARGLACVAITRQNYGEFVGQECAVLVNANGNSRKYIARADPLWDFDASVRSVRASLREFQERVLGGGAAVAQAVSAPAGTRTAPTIRRGRAAAPGTCSARPRRPS